MHDFSDNSLEAELGPYTQGFSLVRYIAKKYGEDAIPKIWKELSKPYRVTLSGALEKVLGVSEDDLYEAWKKEITEHYQAQKDSLGPLVEGTKMTENAFWQDFPVVAGENLYGVSNFGGAWFDGAVFKMPVSETRDTVPGVEIGNIAIEKDASDSADTILIRFPRQEALVRQGYRRVRRQPAWAYPRLRLFQEPGPERSRPLRHRPK